MSIRDSIYRCFPIHKDLAAGQTNLKLWSLNVTIGTLATSFTATVGNSTQGFDTAEEAMRWIEQELAD